jgi:hypothetical protein
MCKWYDRLRTIRVWTSARCCTTLLAYFCLASCGDVDSNLITKVTADLRACVRNDQCSPEKPVCNVGTGRCQGCTADQDCGIPQPRCDAPSGQCVECLANGDCAGRERNLCDTSGHRCVECLIDAHCHSVDERCSAVLGTCAAPCMAVADCPLTDPYCDVAIGFCVECQTDKDCGASGHCRSSLCTP